MRLICGIVRFDGVEVDADLVASMAAAMTHPGLSPQLSTWIAGGIGLGVLDFAAAPVVPGTAIVEREGWVVAADARLDRCADTAADAFVTALAQHGADFPDRVDGDFAVAMWHRDCRQLRLGRDFIGVRPLAWTYRPGGWLAFASLPKGLHRTGLAARSYDPVALACLSAHIYFRRSESGFTDIAYLESGHSLCFDLADPVRPRSHRAYRPDPAQVGNWRGTQAEAAATLRRLIVDAVETRLPPTGPVACHLSGGLDSSAITVLAARAMRQRGGRVLALSVVPTEYRSAPDEDARPMIEAVLQQESDLSARTVCDFIPTADMTPDEDWPCVSIGSFSDIMNDAAAAFGADRVFCGAGGDEGATYNGTNLYYSLLKAGAFRKLIRELPARARHDGVPLWSAIRGRILAPLLPRRLHRWWRWLNRLPMPVDPQRSRLQFLNPALVDTVVAKRSGSALYHNTAEERVRAFADRHLPARCAFNAITGARNGLAFTYPLLDRRVVDFALSLPVHMFLADGQSRQPFRQAMQGILPDMVRLAKLKLGTGDDQFVRYAALKIALLAEVQALRTEPVAAVDQVFDVAAIGEGIALLPDPAEAVAFARGNAAAKRGQPRWLPLMAAGALTIAAHLARWERAQSNCANST